MHRWIAIAALFALAACTFPDVSYVDGGVAGSASTSGSGTGGSATCFAPTTCASDATSCASIATNKHNACTHQCKPSQPDCPVQCDQDLASARTTCSAECMSCASATCGTRATNCDALVGL